MDDTYLEPHQRLVLRYQEYVQTIMVMIATSGFSLLLN